MKSKALGASPIHRDSSHTELLIFASPTSFVHSLASNLCTFWSPGSRYLSSTYLAVSHSKTQLCCQTGKLFSYYLSQVLLKMLLLSWFVCCCQSVWRQPEFLSFVNDMAFLKSWEYFYIKFNTLTRISQSWLYRSIFPNSWWFRSVCRSGLPLVFLHCTF